MVMCHLGNPYQSVLAWFKRKESCVLSKTIQSEGSILVSLQWEAPVLHTVDIACAVMVLWFEACVEAGISPELLVRTFDLKSAYRQVGLSSSGRDHACIRVFDPTSGKVKLFRSNVLPFGSIRSVHSFLRLSRAIWWTGVVGYRLVWTSFYDDFTVVLNLLVIRMPQFQPCSSCLDGPLLSQ